MSTDTPANHLDARAEFLFGWFAGGYNAEVKLSHYTPLTPLQPIMQTYDSFNALAAGQGQPLVSGMSVFNAATPRQLQSLEKAINTAYDGISRAFEDIYRTGGFGGFEGLRADLVKATDMLNALRIKASGAVRQVKPE